VFGVGCIPMRLACRFPSNLGFSIHSLGAVKNVNERCFTIGFADVNQRVQIVVFKDVTGEASARNDLVS